MLNMFGDIRCQMEVNDSLIYKWLLYLINDKNYSFDKLYIKIFNILYL